MAVWGEKEKETERFQEDLDQQLEAARSALEAVREEKGSLQAQIITVRVI